MGAMLFGINPVLAFIQRFIPRLLDGFLLGYVFRYSRKAVGDRIACMITGFCSAFFNTAFFMSLLVLLFGNTSYVQGLMGGKNAILFICSFVGVNAVFEMCASTFLTGAVGLALIQVATTGHSKVMIPLKPEVDIDALSPDLNALTAISKQIGCNGFFPFQIRPGKNETDGRMFSPAIGIGSEEWRT